VINGERGDGIDPGDRVGDDAVDEFFAGGQVIDDAGDLTGARTPALVLPSTRPARSSIGVLAAMTTWDQLRSLAFRMARPSRTRVDHVIPVIPLNFAAFDTAALRPRQRPDVPAAEPVRCSGRGAACRRSQGRRRCPAAGGSGTPA